MVPQSTVASHRVCLFASCITLQTLIQSSRAGIATVFIGRLEILQIRHLVQLTSSIRIEVVMTSFLLLTSNRSKFQAENSTRLYEPDYRRQSGGLYAAESFDLSTFRAKWDKTWRKCWILNCYFDKPTKVVSVVSKGIGVSQVLPFVKPDHTPLMYWLRLRIN